MLFQLKAPAKPRVFSGVKKMALLAAACLSLFSVSTQADRSGTIRLPSFDNEPYRYNRGLLKLLMAEVDQKYTVEVVNKSFNRKRMESALENDVIDVGWFPANAELMDKFITLKYPMYKGLASYRIPLVKEQYRDRFNNVNSISELKTQYSGGSGLFWSTTEIYNATGFNLTTSAKKSSLFYMLEGERFDYFLRGVNEVKNELKIYEPLNLVIDPNIIVYMPSVSYFFVNPKRTELAEDLKRGFQNIVNNGKYDEYIKNSYLYKDLVDIIKENNQRVLRVEHNPFNAPENDPDRWFDINQVVAR